MRFLHTGDLHIGKRVNEFSMIEDQIYILKEILRIVDETGPEGVIIAGDVYDKSIPSGEAVEVLDEFLTGLIERKKEIFLISGNHDSAERLSFGSRIMEERGLHIVSSCQGGLRGFRYGDSYGILNVYCMPFLRPANVSVLYPKEDSSSYERAVRTVMGHVKLNLNERNLLIAHQFVTNAGSEVIRSDSELSLGGLDDVNCSVFEGFDYVALGHIHGPQFVGRPTIRYAGSPLKYSFSEARQNKSVTLLEMKEKGKVEFEKIPLVPLRDMRQIKGCFEEITREDIVREGNPLDYIQVTLTDENTILDPVEKLRVFYPNLMKLDFESRRSAEAEDSKTAASGDVSQKGPLELFQEFYYNRNNTQMTEEECALVKRILEEMGGVEA